MTNIIIQFLTANIWRNLAIFKINHQWFITIFTLGIHQAHQKIHIHIIPIFYISTCFFILVNVVHNFILKIYLYVQFIYILFINIIFIKINSIQISCSYNDCPIPILATISFAPIIYHNVIIHWTALFAMTSVAINIYKILSQYLQFYILFYINYYIL